MIPILTNTVGFPGYHLATNALKLPDYMMLINVWAVN